MQLFNGQAESTRCQVTRTALQCPFMCIAAFALTVQDFGFVDPVELGDTAVFGVDRHCASHHRMSAGRNLLPGPT